MQAQILVPLDGTPRAEAILTPLIPLAHATGSYLTLVQVIALDEGISPLIAIPLPPEPTPEWQEMVHQDVASYLSEVAHRVERPGWPVRTAVLEGTPREAILDYVTHHPEVRLIAMTTHGRRGLNRWIFGSLAEEILHQAPVPVVLLRMPAGTPPEGAEAALRTIVVPLDGSDFAEGALDLATTLAQATGARLVLLTVVEGVDAASAATEEVPHWLLERRQAEIARLALYQQDWAARVEAEGVKVGVVIGDGHPAEVIRNLSAEVKADLIVMATHGRTGFQRLRLGSVALEVMENADRPVCLVRVPTNETRSSDLAALGAAVGNRAGQGVDPASAGN
jgi:nucleotide-binding universal stress UspA family protein